MSNVSYFGKELNRLYALKTPLFFMAHVHLTLNQNTLTAKGEILTAEDEVLGVLPLGSTYLELKHLNNLIHYDFLSISSDPQLLLHDDSCQEDCVEIFYFDFALNRHQTVFMQLDGESSHIEATLLLELDSVLFRFED